MADRGSASISPCHHAADVEDSTARGPSDRQAIRILACVDIARSAAK
ncbi:hypothetical protein [Williamsia herbipolensis]|nr:hypothetical protein [Williamsia herbipolensis]